MHDSSPSSILRIAESFRSSAAAQHSIGSSNRSEYWHGSRRSPRRHAERKLALETLSPLVHWASGIPLLTTNRDAASRQHASLPTRQLLAPQRTALLPTRKTLYVSPRFYGQLSYVPQGQTRSLKKTTSRFARRMSPGSSLFPSSVSITRTHSPSSAPRSKALTRTS